MKIRKGLVVFNVIIGITMSLFMFSACNGKTKTVNSLKELIEFSEDKIENVKISEKDGKPYTINDKEEIKMICDSLSQVAVKENPKEKKIPDKVGVTGGRGNAFTINYKSGNPCYIQYYETKGQVQVSGNTKNGEIKDKWSVYTVSDVSQLKAVEEITAPFFKE